MKYDAIMVAKAEAKRLIDRIEEWELSRKQYEVSGHKYFVHSPKESGALRRASMDLTRALAEMRKP